MLYCIYSRLAFCRYEKFSLISLSPRSSSALSNYSCFLSPTAILNTHDLLKTRKEKEILYGYSLKQPTLNTVCNTQNTILKKKKKRAPNNLWTINWVDNANRATVKRFKSVCPSSERIDEGLTLEMSAFQSLYDGQFTLLTQLIKPNYLVILPPTQQHSFFN